MGVITVVRSRRGKGGCGNDMGFVKGLVGAWKLLEASKVIGSGFVLETLEKARR